MARQSTCLLPPLLRPQKTEAGNARSSLDGTPASITVLPLIAEAVKGDVPLILDSGIRRGTDVVKALALGANAVAIGRPVMYGLALGGGSGVDSVIDYFHRETVDTMLHCGVNRIAELGSKHVRRAAVPGAQGLTVAAPRLS